MQIAQLYLHYKTSYTVSTDTRNIKKGCLFFALKGENFNGNKFAKEALEKGAAYAIVDEANHQTNEKIILVDDVLKTLQSLATYHRRVLEIPIIALTGSNGKTTTKELINAVLSESFLVTATQGNLNNHIGVPLTLLSMTPNTQIGIVEMGANHLEEIDFLCKLAEPDYGYITNFGKAHLEGFGSLEGVIQGKTELFRYIAANHKKVFVSTNDSKQLALSEDIDRILFGQEASTIRIEFLEANPFVHVAYNTRIIKSQLIGIYNFNNIAAAIAIGAYFKVDDELIQKAIENYIPTNNRSQIIEKGKHKIILDAYNANPSSMKAALENLAGLSENNKIAILGDMFELGSTASAEHQFIVDLAVSLSLTTVFLVGAHFSETTIKNQKVKAFETFEDFKAFLTKTPLEKATILIKASRGMALERTLELF